MDSWVQYCIMNPSLVQGIFGWKKYFMVFQISYMGNWEKYPFISLSRITKSGDRIKQEYVILIASCKRSEIKKVGNRFGIEVFHDTNIIPVNWSTKRFNTPSFFFTNYKFSWGIKRIKTLIPVLFFFQNHVKFQLFLIP